MPKKKLRIIIGSLIAVLLLTNLYIFRDKLSFLADINPNPGETTVAHLTNNGDQYDGSTIANPR